MHLFASIFLVVIQTIGSHVQGVSGQEAGHCIMYDTCGWDADYGPDGGNQVHFLNCHYTGPAKPATDEMLTILQEVCPHLYANGEPQNLCCGLRQLKDLQENFILPQSIIEAPCPTCYYNFRKNFCDMTCSPDQSLFVRADHLVDFPGFDLGDEDYTGRNVTMVKDLTYFVAEEFNTKTFDSCVNVQFPALSDTIMGMMCGPWGSAYCTAKRFWDFLGSVENGYSPFPIWYEYGTEETSEDGHIYHNPDVLTCNTTAPGYNYPCSCPNCPSTCTFGRKVSI